MECNFCGSLMDLLFTETLLGKYDVKYYGCPKCSFLRTETPYWLDEAYRESINLSDTGILARNLTFVERFLPLFYFCLDCNSRFLDYGGGYGIFVRLMRDAGLDFFWSDPYTENIIARGFEYNDKQETRFEAVTCFEVIEHSENPVKVFDDLLFISDTVFFSTQLHPGINDQGLKKWEYLDPSHGQHISFMSLNALNYYAQKHHLYFYSNHRDLHVFSRKKLFSQWLTNLFLGMRHRYAIFFAEFVKIKLKSKTVMDCKYLREKK